MIPYDDLERALARWKAKGQSATAEVAPASDGGETDGDSAPRREKVNGQMRASELSGEIDLNELVEE